MKLKIIIGVFLGIFITFGIVIILYLILTKKISSFNVPDVLTIKNSYILNLDKDKDRLEKSYKHCKIAGLQPKRIAGILGKDLGSKDHIINKGILDPNYIKPHDVGDSNNWIACFMGIGKMLSEIAKLNDDEYGLIMEDDIFFVKDFDKKLKILIEKIGNNWDIIHLGLSDYCLEHHIQFNKKDKCPVGCSEKYVKFEMNFDKNHKIYKWQNLDDYFYKNHFIGGNFGVLVKPRAARLWIETAYPIKHAADVHFNYIIQKFNLNAYFVNKFFINYFRDTTNINPTGQGGFNKLKEQARVNKLKKLYNI